MTGTTRRSTIQQLSYGQIWIDNVDGTHHYEVAQSSGDTAIKLEVSSDTAMHL